MSKFYSNFLPERKYSANVVVFERFSFQKQGCCLIWDEYDHSSPNNENKHEIQTWDFNILFWVKFLIINPA